MKDGKYNIVVGLQAGSESKGKISAHLADKWHPDLITGNFSPNAGHTIVINGKKKIVYNIPAASLVIKSPICLGPGSAININVLKNDIKTAKVEKERLFIDEKAVVIQDRHIKAEREKLKHISSTAQGVGYAYSERLLRQGRPILVEDFKKEFEKFCIVTNTSNIINEYLEKNKSVLGEMTQGFDLDILHGIKYPFCTSRSINPSQMLSESGVSPSYLGEVYGVFRPYPIRVNNAEGYSGPYDDAKEITWKEIQRRCGAPFDITEYTTTTKRERRVFEFSSERFTLAMKICKPTVLAINFVNYIDWKAYKVRNWKNLPQRVKDRVLFFQDLYNTPIEIIGTGPDHFDIFDNHIDDETKMRYARFRNWKYVNQKTI